MKPAGNASATEGVTLSGVPKGMGLSADSTLENPIKLGAEGANAFVRQSLRQKDKVRYIYSAYICALLFLYRYITLVGQAFMGCPIFILSQYVFYRRDRTLILLQE